MKDCQLPYSDTHHLGLHVGLGAKLVQPPKVSPSYLVDDGLEPTYQCSMMKSLWICLNASGIFCGGRTCSSLFISVGKDISNEALLQFSTLTNIASQWVSEPQSNHLCPTFTVSQTMFCCGQFTLPQPLCMNTPTKKLMSPSDQQADSFMHPNKPCHCKQSAFQMGHCMMVGLVLCQSFHTNCIGAAFPFLQIRTTLTTA